MHKFEFWIKAINNKQILNDNYEITMFGERFETECIISLSFDESPREELFQSLYFL